MIIDKFILMHLRHWIISRAPIRPSQTDDAFQCIVDWLEQNEDEVTEPACDAGWPRVFELACGNRFNPPAK